MIEINKEILNEFTDITGSNITSFLLEYSIFFQNDYNEINNFYQGKTKSINPEVFNNFKRLKESIGDVIVKFQQFNMQLENIKFVELLQLIEECNDVLQTLNNINKWSRVTTDFFGYNSTQKVEHVLGQNETLEKLATSILSSVSPQNDWYNIAIENNLYEDNYTSEGGKVLNVTTANNGFENFKIRSVVDVISGKSVYGRDLDQNIHFDIESQDLKVLSEDETIQQAVTILVTLRKNDNLDFLSNGLQTSLAVGKSKSLLNFPVIERQLQDTFNNDDTLKNFTVKKMYVDQDNLFCEFEVSTRLGEVLQLTSEI